ncbi:hypothetical protein BJV74DRAFT_857598 [Russula compacta]|nr:hypothetical protein BJV74DRAFT_857598 [Russula compacta]
MSIFPPVMSQWLIDTVLSSSLHTHIIQLHTVVFFFALQRHHITMLVIITSTAYLVVFITLLDRILIYHFVVE